MLGSEIDPINGVAHRGMSFGFADPEPVMPVDTGSDFDQREVDQLMQEQIRDDARDLAEAQAAAVRLVLRTPEAERTAAWQDVVKVACPRLDRTQLYVALQAALAEENAAAMAAAREERAGIRSLVAGAVEAA